MFPEENPAHASDNQVTFKMQFNASCCHLLPDGLTPKTLKMNKRNDFSRILNQSAFAFLNR